mmetsp:Transcript_6339/g.18214  ORF Transcript_6339/g.18214 Transcript_6339/m.18214 type:complete len:686 (+) Transcript_6339:188-2245(+)|eukprot:CAMPEP_0206147316 /NCGR_PEP_ID=MMETSP1473-20131121/33066_1 /ASSEMBLY_ACC=CAM_ASM_001109 /TAXON_ID=1461547 /ORGANISM="Stichococcus sp, Strain RCC1054" /LENGTH=685 /DNA_ID=CAMNT_0053544205 /DNA_START=117 /DNA_END=2174 /DNA_ORIENTATION=+
MTAARGNKAKAQVLSTCDMSTLLEAEDANVEGLWTASKVIATIGPASQDVDTLSLMLEAGMTCVRLDLTWGTLEYHKQTLRNVAEASKRTHKLCAVMVDTLGREIVVQRPSTRGPDGWPVHEECVDVKAGGKVTLTTKPAEEAAKDHFSVSYKNLPSMCEVGDTIFLGRYLVTGADESSLFMEVESITETEVVCVAGNDAVLGGLLTVFHTERSVSSLTNLQNELPVLAEADKTNVKAIAAEFEIDFLSLSFVRSGDDVKSTRKYLNSIGLNATKILAKFESRQSLFNFKGIAAASDGIIMSRGNLGLDVVPEKMALIQKAMIANCNILGKPVIITRLVDTMGSNPRPTRAEATDVANAVIDGADAFLLGAETLRGKNPVLTVTTILAIARQAENSFDHTQHFDYLMSEALIAHKAEGVEASPSTTSFLSDQYPASPGHSMHGGGGSGSGLRKSGSGAFKHAFSSSANFQRGAYQSDGDFSKQRLASPFLSRQEAIASSAVRAADKVGASLIIVYTGSGQTASLVSKYRPPMPILTLVVPQLRSNGLSWSLTGRSVARQCLIERGLLPVLAAPSPSGETLLEEAVTMTTRWGLVKPNDHIVCIQQIHDSFVIKIVSVDDAGAGIKDIRPESLVNLIQATSKSDRAPVQLKNSMSRLPSTNLGSAQPPGVQTNVAAVNAAKLDEQN